MGVRKMGRPREVVLLLSLFVLLGALHGTRAQYDNYDYEDYDEADNYDFAEDENVEEEDYLEEDADASGDTEDGDEGGRPPTTGPPWSLNPMCDNDGCWIRVDWEPPPRETWMSCLLGYKLGFRKPGEEWTWLYDEGTHIDLRSEKLFFLKEAEGTNHSMTIQSLDYGTGYSVVVVVFNPYGTQEWHEHPLVYTPPEPCRDASVPHPDQFVESSVNSLSVHLNGWQDANCQTMYFVVEQRERGQQEWRSVSRSAKPGADILISNLSPATWYQIKVTGERSGPTAGPLSSMIDGHTALQFEIATHGADDSGFSGCVIEKDVKYWGNTFSSKRGINQETCALLCFKKPSCTHWTHNPTYQGGKCWMKTSDSGRTKSTTGSSSGQKACGGRGFSLPEVTKSAAEAMASCNPPWTSLSTGCYLFQDWNSTWYESRRECKQSGGFLVEIDSEEEQDTLMNEITARGWDGETHFGFWIGLTDIFHDGTWVWDNLGRPLNFSYWANGEPNNWNGIQHCAAINLRWADGGWEDVGCDAVLNKHNTSGGTYSHICEASGESMSYTRETGVKWQNEVGKTSHMKVLMVHSVEDCEKECMATAPCVAYTFIPGMEICALKAPKDAATTVDAGMSAEIISGKLDEERPTVGAQELDSTICLPCLPACNVEEGTKYSGYNLYPLGAETQEECAVACLREPECHFWTHNPNVGRCWLKKSDLGRAPSSKGSNSGQKSCGVTEDEILSSHIIEDGCNCTTETTADCLIEENTKYSGHNLYTTKGIKVGNRAGCASLCFNDNKCKFWTYNPRVSKCWMKTSDQGRSPSTKGSISGQKVCGAPGVLSEEPESLPTSGVLTSPNFPSDYPNDLHQRKTIEVAKGNVVNIRFTDFSLESPDLVDYVELTDGDGTSLGHFASRQQLEGVITSKTETLHVLFHTDGSVTEKGWMLEWWSTSKPPREESWTSNGVMTSPNFGKGPYPNNLHFEQTIQVDKGKTIKIDFTDFRIERCPYGECDWVEINEEMGQDLQISVARPVLRRKISSLKTSSLRQTE